MAMVTVLGGSGAVGSVAAHYLVHSGVFSDVVLADANVEKARQIAEGLGRGATAASVDAGETASLREVIEGSDVVLNCVGPFFRYAPTVLGACIASKIDYVDVCDDFDATEALFAMDGDVKAAGISALVGMGSSPGAANVIARFAADFLYDAVESIDIYHAHGGIADEEGRAVVAHRLHSMMIDIPVFLDGKMQTARLFEDSGRALEEECEFADIGTFPVYAYPHPETITFPKFIPGLKQVTNKGLVLPPAYAELIKSFVRNGVTSDEPLDVRGQAVPPFEFAISFILSQRRRLAEEARMTKARGCLKIVVTGVKDGRRVTYVVSLSSKGQGMGQGTGIPAAAGAILMGTGKITAKGALPPEASVNPLDFFSTASGLVKGGDGGGGLPITIQKVVDGSTETIDVGAFLGS